MLQGDGEGINMRTVTIENTHQEVVELHEKTSYLMRVNFFTDDLVQSARMKAALICLVFLVSATVHASDWTTGDTVRESIYMTLHTIDYGQTRYSAKHPHDANQKGYKEDNPFLGNHPEQYEISRYFILTGVLHVGISYLLPREYRVPFQYVTIGVESIYVLRNYSIGVKISF
jgi:hypothetical protein